MADKFSHVDQSGKASMVDITDKPVTKRQASAEAYIYMQANTIEKVLANDLAKGDVLAVARIAGIQGAKNVRILFRFAIHWRYQKSRSISKFSVTMVV